MAHAPHSTLTKEAAAWHPNVCHVMARVKPGQWTVCVRNGILRFEHQYKGIFILGLRGIRWGRATVAGRC